MGMGFYLGVSSIACVVSIIFTTHGIINLGKYSSRSYVAALFNFFFLSTLYILSLLAKVDDDKDYLTQIFFQSSIVIINVVYYSIWHKQMMILRSKIKNDVYGCADNAAYEKYSV